MRISVKPKRYMGIGGFVLPIRGLVKEPHNKALTISREIGDRQGEGSHLGNLGRAYDSHGQYDKAIEYYTQALAIFEEIKSPYADWARQRISELKTEKDS